MYTKYGTVTMILFCKYKMTITRYNALYEIAIYRVADTCEMYVIMTQETIITDIWR